MSTILGPIALSVAVLGAGQPVVAQTGARTSGAEQTLIELSRQKWRWMAERNVDALSRLFDD